MVDSREWEANANALSIADEEAVDVPPPWDSVSRYCASLGHKANHCFSNNAQYELAQHPRLGLIKCLRTLRPVAAGEEITVRWAGGRRSPAPLPVSPLKCLLLSLALPSSPLAFPLLG